MGVIPIHFLFNMVLPQSNCCCLITFSPQWTEKQPWGGSQSKTWFTRTDFCSGADSQTFLNLYLRTIAFRCFISPQEFVNIFSLYVYSSMMSNRKCPGDLLCCYNGLELFWMESSYHEAALTLKLQDRTHLGRSEETNKRCGFFFIRMLLTEHSP